MVCLCLNYIDNAFKPVEYEILESKTCKGLFLPEMRVCS